MISEALNATDNNQIDGDEARRMLPEVHEAREVLAAFEAQLERIK